MEKFAFSGPIFLTTSGVTYAGERKSRFDSIRPWLDDLRYSDFSSPCATFVFIL